MVSTSQSALDSMCKMESQRTGTLCVSEHQVIKKKNEINRLWITHVRLKTCLSVSSLKCQKSRMLTV